MPQGGHVAESGAYALDGLIYWLKLAADFLGIFIGRARYTHFTTVFPPHERSIKWRVCAS